MDTSDRWYLRGPLGVNTSFDETTDTQSVASLSFATVGSAIRHSQADTLNLLDARSAAPEQGPTLNFWALNAANPPKAVRLGAIAARFETTADGGSAGYLGLLTKGSGGDITEAVRISTTGNVGVGSRAPTARLSVVAPGASELAGTAHSATLRTMAGPLGAANGTELPLASIGFTSGNNSGLGVRARRVADGNGWTTSAIGLGMDVDNTVRVNNSSVWFHANGNIGIGTASPGAKLDVSGTGASQCCAPVPPTLALSENSAGTQRQAWLQFHNGGEVEAYIRLAGGGPAGSGREGPRRLEISDSQVARTGLQVSGDISAGGQLNWSGDTSANGSVRIGKLQISWGTGIVTTGTSAGEYYSHVNFPQPFNRNPAVTVSLNDPGFGVATMQGGAGVWNLSVGGFDVLYKFNLNRAHSDTFYWIALGTWI